MLEFYVNKYLWQRQALQDKNSNGSVALGFTIKQRWLYRPLTAFSKQRQALPLVQLTEAVRTKSTTQWQRQALQEKTFNGSVALGFTIKQRWLYRPPNFFYKQRQAVPCTNGSVRLYKIKTPMDLQRQALQLSSAGFTDH